MKTVGIEKINVYPSQMMLDLSLLAKHRGYDVERMKNDLMVHERSIIPPWEDTVTMAVNAAKPLLKNINTKDIDLLIVATETGLDQEKSVSTWVHHFLNLPSSCRNFELKSACYSGTAAMKTALFWLLSGLAGTGKKALVIASDKSLIALNEPYEYVSGGGAAAILLSDTPDFLIIEQEKYGIHAEEVSDVIRPLPWVETGNSETSLFSYMDCLLDAYDAYVDKVGNEDLNYFNYNIYHMPFAGISFRAHKRLLPGNEEAQASFDRKTKPSLAYPQRIGGTYGANIFISMLSLIDCAQEIRANDRIGIFSYGSGACSEYYSALVTEKSKAVAKEANLRFKLDNRKSVSIEEYEYMELSHAQMTQEKTYLPDFSIVTNYFLERYVGNSYLYLREKKDYYRFYEWS